MRTFEDFYENIQLEIRERALGEAMGGVEDGRPPDFKENVFTSLMLEYLGDQGIGDDVVSCHYSAKTTKGYTKINSWAVNDEEGIATLCVSLFQGTSDPVRLTKTDIDQTVSKTVRAFEQAVDGFHQKMEPASESFGMMRRLYEAQADIATVQIILLTDGLLPAEIKKQRDRHGPYSFKYDFWDLQRLYRIVSSELPYESVEINLHERFELQIPCLPPVMSTDDHTVYLTVLPGFVLSELYEEFGSQLLDLNVRSFLQARGKVNKGIRDTLCAQPCRFLAYNNGISATAERVEIVRDINGTSMIKSLTGFQIVNGGQTMASIHRAHKIEKADISGVFVQAKITEVIPGKIEELAPLISRYANTQNKVNEADFSSNDAFNVELQRLSEKFWVPGEQSRWFYERTRGQYQVEKLREGPTGSAKAKQFERKCPPFQRFTKTEMAKYLNCWEQRPHVVSLGSQKNFVIFMDSLHERMSKDWRPDEKYYKELIAKTILTKEADKVARSEGIQAYKANVVAYTVALLSERSLGRLDLIEIWNKQAAPDFVIETFRTWMPKVYEIIIHSAGQRNVTEWCKKEACWMAVRDSDLEPTLELKNELERSQPLPTVGASRLKKQASLSSEDRENIARTMQVDAPTWFRLSVWGQKKKRLKDWQCGLAHTLSAYAAGEWAKVPSAKQALQAVRILKIAEDEGEFFRD